MMAPACMFDIKGITIFITLYLISILEHVGEPWRRSEKIVTIGEP